MIIILFFILTLLEKRFRVSVGDVWELWEAHSKLFKGTTLIRGGMCSSDRTSYTTNNPLII